MIDKTKQYKTRDGREVRIYATDAGGDFPVHGAIKTGDEWESNSWKLNGNWRDHLDEEYDLIEVKPRIKRTYWVNVYPERVREKDYAHHTRQSADSFCNIGRIACVKVEIDCEEGEGL